jgi:hypothetical protein
LLSTAKSRLNYLTPKSKEAKKDLGSRSAFTEFQNASPVPAKKLRRFSFQKIAAKHFT